jgi:hypothetical protein
MQKNGEADGFSVSPAQSHLSELGPFGRFQKRNRFLEGSEASERVGWMWPVRGLDLSAIYTFLMISLSITSAGYLRWRLTACVARRSDTHHAS